MARRKRKTAYRRRKTYRRRSGFGLAGVSAPKDLKNDMLDIVAMGVGTFAAVKGVGMLDKVINKSGTKVMGMISPAVAALAGAAGATMMTDRFVKSLAKGVAMGGAFKLLEKALNKENLLSGLDDDDQPLMLPGIGSYGQAALPELSHYSENPEAPVTTTGGDPQYHMGQPSEMLSGDDEIIAY
jgi:hypothetical protein